MTPETFITNVMGIPFKFGRGDWLACDCWGLVELWYREILGIELDDRAGHGVNHGAVQRWFNSAPTRWNIVEAPHDNDLVVMRVGKLNAAHVGIIFDNGVLHTSDGVGCAYQSLDSKDIKPFISCYMTYR